MGKLERKWQQQRVSQRRQMAYEIAERLENRLFDEFVKRQHWDAMAMRGLCILYCIEAVEKSPK